MRIEPAHKEALQLNPNYERARQQLELLKPERNAL